MSGNAQTEPIDFFFEFTRSFTGSLFEMINNERRCICHDGFIKEISTDDLRECAVVHDRKKAITILENINRIFEDYLSKAGLEEKNADYQAQITELQSKIDDENKRSDELSEYEKYVKTKKFVEEIAKNKFGLIYPDELVFKPNNK